MRELSEVSEVSEVSSEMVSNVSALFYVLREITIELAFEKLRR